MDYEPFALYAAGFEPGIPDFEAIKKNAAGNSRLPPSLSALTFWGMIFNALKGDKITITVTDSNGDVFATRDVVQDKTRARQFYYAGKKINDRMLFPGTYKGKMTLTRILPDGSTISKDIDRNLTISP